MKTSPRPTQPQSRMSRTARLATAAVATLALLALGACGDDEPAGGADQTPSAGSRPGSGTLGSEASDGPTLAAGEQPTTEATSEAPAPTEEDPELITYAGGEAVGPLIRTDADVDELEGAPEDFKTFIGTAANELSEQIDCDQPDGVGFSVDVIRTDGFAAGNVRDCGGGAKVLWASVDGEWQEVGASQEIWDCALLAEFEIPNDVLFGETACYDTEAGKQSTHTQA